MVTINTVVEFILNNESVRAHVPQGMLVLEYLRNEKNMTGTKSGCKEGDCGACSVILGELKDDKIDYRPMTSCLLPMGELQGKHLVTIEGLNMEDLSPVQKAMVDCGGTQCGYCTPGFVVCMTAGLMAPQIPLDDEGVLYAISGNLCRCTGYHSIIEAGQQVIRSLRAKLVDNNRIDDLVNAGALPDYFSDIIARLSAISVPKPLEFKDIDRAGTLVAGGTDLYVQRGDNLVNEPISLLNTVTTVPPAYTANNYIVVDARMTFEAFATDPLILSSLNSIDKYNLLMASWPIRTRSTLGGNLCNASPIADMTCLLLALDSHITITNSAGSNRTLPLNEFYLGYKKLNKDKDEIVTQIFFPVLNKNTYVNWEKVSKRAWLDIATVNAAAKITVYEDCFSSATLAIGGVSAIPLYLNKASAYLVNKPISIETVSACLSVAQTEFNPIGDVRGSQKYKRLLARQLLAANFITLLPKFISAQSLYETLR